MAGYAAPPRNDAINAIVGITPPPTEAANRKWCSLHTADPGTTGASEVAGGSYARVATTWPGRSSPAAPVPTQTTSGGTVATGTYTVAVTYVDANGETAGSLTGTVTTTTSASTITVPSPAASTGATGWYAYVSQAGGTTLTRQQTAGSPTAIGTNLTLTAPPTNTGANPSTANTTGASGGVLAGSAVTINVPASTTVAYFGVWDASSSGTWITGGALPASETFSGAGTYTLTPELTD